MSDYSDKRQQALEACEKVINEIEDEKVSISSALLQCRKIARLVGDLEGQEWLGYEHGGYPITQTGGILPSALKYAIDHGRLFKEKNSAGNYVDVLFTDLCSVLEESTESMKMALRNYTTQGFSAGGEYAAIATGNLTHAVYKHTNELILCIGANEKKLSILKSQYYDYAIKWKIELAFGHITKTIFESYQAKIDQHYSELPQSIILKESTIEDMMQDGNPENYAHVLTSCRRLWTEIANHLFSEVFPNLPETYKTLSGDEKDVSKGHDNNRLSAVIEKLQSKAPKNTLVGSGIMYLADWLKQINDIQNAGVHSDVTKEQAERCIIHTYIALGDILSLKAEAGKKDSSEESQQP